VAFIGSVGVAAVDRAPYSSPSSCFLLEEEEGRNGKLGWALVAGLLGFGSWIMAK
jgi:hypothetical protein